MPIPDLKELDALIALCRKRGVKSLSCDGIQLELGDLPPKTPRRQRSEAPSDPLAAPDWDALSPEEKLLWSAVPTGKQVGEGS